MNSVEPIFIVGLPRTGSKMYRNVLNAHQDVCITSELLVKTPRFSRTDVMRKVMSKSQRESIGEIEAFCELVKSGSFEASYWRSKKFDLGVFLKEVSHMDDFNLKEVIHVCITANARFHNRVITGAKFPVHIYNIQDMYRAFPNAKYVYLARDLRAVAASQLKKYNSLSPFSIKHWNVIFALVLSQWKGKRFADSMKGQSNFIQMKYEEVIKNPEREFTRLYNFLSLDFQVSNLRVPRVGASHANSRSTVGISQFSKDRWKKDLGRLDKIILSILK